MVVLWVQIVMFIVRFWMVLVSVLVSCWVYLLLLLQKIIALMMVMSARLLRRLWMIYAVLKSRLVAIVVNLIRNTKIKNLVTFRPCIVGTDMIYFPRLTKEFIMIAFGMPGPVELSILLVLVYVVPIALVIWIVKKLTKR